MFFRTKKSGTRSYLQIVENRWEDGRPKQRVIARVYASQWIGWGLWIVIKHYL
jgi:hypothetical protein